MATTAQRPSKPGDMGVGVGLRVSGQGVTCQEGTEHIR